MNEQCFGGTQQPDFWVRLRSVLPLIAALAIGIWLFYVAQRAGSRRQKIVLWTTFSLYALIAFIVMTAAALGGLANNWLTCGLS